MATQTNTLQVLSANEFFVPCHECNGHGEFNKRETIIYSGQYLPHDTSVKCEDCDEAGKDLVLTEELDDLLGFVLSYYPYKVQIENKTIWSFYKADQNPDEEGAIFELELKNNKSWVFNGIPEGVEEGEFKTFVSEGVGFNFEVTQLELLEPCVVTRLITK